MSYKDSQAAFDVVKVDGSNDKVGTPRVNVLITDVDQNVLMAKGATVPTDADAGYAKGCIFIDTDASAGAVIWINEGSATSANFNAFSTTEASQTFLGDVTIGDSIDSDTLILKARLTTSTEAGASLALGSTYAYGEAIELRYNITNWDGIGSAFKALYLRSEADLGGAFGLRGAEIYGVMDTSTTTGLSNLQTLYTEMLVKASSSNRTLTNGGSIEANISIENQTGTLTLTNNIYCLYAKAQTGTGIADYTKVNGIKIAGRDDGTARVFGNALDISDPEATVCTWTKAINITTASKYGIVATAVSSTVSGEEHAFDFANTGTLSSGDSVVGLNVVTTTAGTAGSWVSAIYAKTVQGAVKNVNGYLSAAELEVVNSADNVSDNFVLVLNNNNSGNQNGQHESYVAIRSYGSLAPQSLLWFGGDANLAIAADGNTTALLSANNPTAATHCIRIIIGDTPYWIMCVNAAGLTA